MIQFKISLTKNAYSCLFSRDNAGFARNRILLRVRHRHRGRPAMVPLQCQGGYGGGVVLHLWVITNDKKSPDPQYRRRGTRHIKIFNKVTMVSTSAAQLKVGSRKGGIYIQG